MSDKPSLYVVEKKEVVILVILFVLVTVLSFTMGVRYGESVGKKSARDQEHAQEEIGTSHVDATGGSLGAHSEGAKGGEAAKGGEHGGAHKADSHSAPATGEHGKAAAHGKVEAEPGKGSEPAPSAPAKEVVEKSSDEFLLNALKEAGVEPPGGKAPGEAKLPADVKKVKAGSYVIQVGSHPTRNEAESQVRQLRQKKVSAEILAPFKDRQGEWHRVVIGSYKNKRDAEREASSLKSRGAILSFFIWRLP